MKKSDMHALPPLDPGAAEPFYRQIYLRFRHAIAEGLLKPGERIPAARTLAEELGLARGTVEAAYALLNAEGYVETRGQAGTVVTPGLKPDSAALPAARPASSRPAASNAVSRNTGTSTKPASILLPPLRPFQLGVPALDAFPRKIWARLAARAVRATQIPDMMYPQVFGQQALRVQIARYLQLSRGIVCAPEQVFVTSGYRDSLALVARALLNSGDQVWIEDPCYQPSADLLHMAGMRLAPIPVDGEGLQVGQGLQLAPRARAAVVTPAHQSPLCVSLSLPRRMALLDWAARNRSWIVEDDYDGEYRYVGRPLPALKSLDRADRVLYSGTFSKVLFPAIQLAYLVVPLSQVTRFEEVRRAFGTGQPALMQSIVSEFMAEGHFARHIHRMRKLYAERREIAADGLGAVLGKQVQIEAQPGGMHLIMRLRGRRSDRALAARMHEDGMYGHSMAQRLHQAAQPPALLLGFTNIDTARKAQELGKRLLALL
ncbi:PLP-dependent aminotransferase family protein [Herbaspirillum lusitanum]|uniref:PLP-dependent aminotransferase family protein n=1 Tax=Herbaspirillum lusitanum TaxID=213312 RepID=A0ABW9ABC7_9BURK